MTDCDVIPDGCPSDWLPTLYNKLIQYPDLTKVGFSLRIDDIPDTNQRKAEIIDWEEQFWKSRLDEQTYSAHIDTTFAIYRPGIPPYSRKWWVSGRMAPPYIAKHLGWYIDSESPTEEDIFYTQTVKGRSSHWFTKNYLKK